MDGGISKKQQSVIGWMPAFSGTREVPEPFCEIYGIVSMSVLLLDLITRKKGLLLKLFVELYCCHENYV